MTASHRLLRNRIIHRDSWIIVIIFYAFKAKEIFHLFCFFYTDTYALRMKPKGNLYKSS